MRKWQWILLWSLVVGSVVFELLPVHDSDHGAYWWDAVPGFYLWFGFFGCVGIISVSKMLGKKLLQKGEKYYDGD